MPDQSHTAGPWNVQRDALGELAIWDRRGRHLLHGESPIPVEEREANATLMAAAPELVDCLTDMLDAFKKETEGLYGDQADVVARAEAALNQALGLANLATLTPQKRRMRA